MKNIVKEFNITEVLKFLVGGFSAVIIDCLFYYILKKYIDYNVAKIISFAFGAFIGFTINKNWTFKSTNKLNYEISTYILLYVFSLFINTIVNNFVFATTNISFAAFIIATGFSTIINFFGQKFFVFRKERCK